MQIKITGTSAIPTTITIVISVLNNPATIPTDYTFVTTTTLDNYKIS